MEQAERDRKVRLNDHQFFIKKAAGYLDREDPDMANAYLRAAEAIAEQIRMREHDPSVGDEDDLRVDTAEEKVSSRVVPHGAIGHDDKGNPLCPLCLSVLAPLYVLEDDSSVIKGVYLECPNYLCPGGEVCYEATVKDWLGSDSVWDRRIKYT